VDPVPPQKEVSGSRDGSDSSGKSIVEEVNGDRPEPSRVSEEKSPNGQNVKGGWKELAEKFRAQVKYAFSGLKGKAAYAVADTSRRASERALYYSRQFRVVDSRTRQGSITLLRARNRFS